MADVTQTTTWQFKVDFTDLNEFEKRLRTMTELQKDLERGMRGGAGGANAIINESAQVVRATDSVTSAVNRQKQAVEALEAAKRRAGRDTGLFHGPFPANGPVYGPRAGYPRDTGVQFGPMSRPITPRDTGSFYGPAGGPANQAAMLAMQRAIGSRIPGLNNQGVQDFSLEGWNYPIHTHPMFQGRQNQIDALRNHILARHSQAAERMTMDAAFFDSTLGRANSRMAPLGAMSGFSGMGTYGGLSAATMAMMNQRGGGFSGMRGHQFSNLIQAGLGAGAVLDSGNSLSSRLAFGGVMAGNFAQAGGLQGLRSFAGSAIGRGSLIAAPVGLGLEGARRYYQGEADYQGQIGARYDAQFAQRNIYRDYQSQVEQMRRLQGRDRIASSLARREGAQDRYTAGLAGEFMLDREEDMTFTDPVGFVAARRRRRQEISKDLGQLQRHQQLKEQELALTRDPVERREIRRNIASGKARQAALLGGDMQALQDMASAMQDQMGIRDALGERIAEMSGRPLSMEQQRELQRMQKQQQEAKSLLEGWGVRGDMSADSFSGQLGEYQRGVMQQRRQLQRGAEDGIGAVQNERDDAEATDRNTKAVEALDATMRELIGAVKNPQAPQRGGVNAALNEGGQFNFIQSGLNAAMNFMSGGE